MGSKNYTPNSVNRNFTDVITKAHKAIPENFVDLSFWEIPFYKRRVWEAPTRAPVIGLTRL